jgi:hypothetical protein
VTENSFVFLLAFVTLGSFLAIGIWQWRRVQKEKRDGDRRKLERELDPRY